MMVEIHLDADSVVLADSIFLLFLRFVLISPYSLPQPFFGSVIVLWTIATLS